MGKRKTNAILNANFPKQVLAAEIIQGSVNLEERTVDVVWSQGSKVALYDWEMGDYFLTLGLEEENVRLDFAKQGAPLLDSHNKYDGVKSVKGVIDQISVDGKQGLATVRFSSRPDVEPIFQDVQDGIIRFVSVGTKLHKLQDITEDDDKLKHYKAIDHEPLEISLAAIPADRGHNVTQSEQESDERFPVEIVMQSASVAPKKKEPNMARRKKAAATDVATDENDEGTPEGTEVEQTEEGTKTNTPKAAKSEAPKDAELTGAEAEKIVEQAIVAERERISEIGKLVSLVSLPPSFAAELAEGGHSVDKARELVLNKLAEQGGPVIQTGVNVTKDESDVIRQCVSESILHRVDANKNPLTDGAREYMGLSLFEVSKDILARSGVSTRGNSKLRIVEQALHSTSDFPAILADVANKTLRDSYEATPRTFQAWARRSSMSDFKPVSRTQMGESPQLLKVNESGEFTRGTVTDAAETYALETYGRVFSLTRQAIINDDLSAFDRIGAGYGVQAAMLQSDIVYGILAANANMHDGVALFAAGHNNYVASGAAPSIATLGDAREAMRLQTGLDGATLLNLSPSILLVPAALETVSQQLLATIVAVEEGKSNPFAGAFQLVVEPRLDAVSQTEWFVMSTQIDTVEYAYLDGQDSPYLESEVGFDIDGVSYKARLDFAAKAIDWRGMYGNSGTP